MAKIASRIAPHATAAAVPQSQKDHVAIFTGSQLAYRFVGEGAAKFQDGQTGIDLIGLMIAAYPPPRPQEKARSATAQHGPDHRD